MTYKRFIAIGLSNLRQHGPRVLAHKVLWKVRYKNIYPPMLLAFKYCKGQGIEFGAAAYNPFNLPGCLNVAPFSDDPKAPGYQDFLIYKNEQLKNCGRYTAIDLPGEADHVPVGDSSQNYVISSHVVEHLPNLIAAFLEWNRILKPGGIILMIFPKRDTLPQDARRPITPLEHFVQDFETRQKITTHPIAEGDRVGGHYHVFTLQSILELIEWCNAHQALSWKVEATEETDSKVGTGHTVVCRYLPG